MVFINIGVENKMKRISKPEFEKNKFKYMNDIKEGAVFIYPTDTTYGIGCVVSEIDSISRLREAKNAEHPFSIIAPNKEWIYQNFELDNNAKKEIEEKLPGKYTLILKLKNSSFLPKNITNGKEKVSVRMLGHWFQSFVEELEEPLVVTSITRKGQTFVDNLDDVHTEIHKNTLFAIEEGNIPGEVSTLIDLSK